MINLSLFEKSSQGQCELVYKLCSNAISKLARQAGHKRPIKKYGALGKRRASNGPTLYRNYGRIKQCTLAYIKLLFSDSFSAVVSCLVLPGNFRFLITCIRGLYSHLMKEWRFGSTVWKNARQGFHSRLWAAFWPALTWDTPNTNRNIDNQ